MKIYVDFDGVIMDSQSHIFDEYDSMIEQGLIKDDHEYMAYFDWESHLRNCYVIADAIKILKEVKKDVIILGRINTDSEREAKLKLLDSFNYDKPVIFLPFRSKKTEYADVKNNILIDDTVHNLEDWENAGGYPIYFNKDEKNIDSWGRKNTKYKTIKTLELLYNIDEKDIH